MKVKLEPGTYLHDEDNVRHEPGEIVEVSEDLGQALLRGHSAQRVDD